MQFWIFKGSSVVAIHTLGLILIGVILHLKWINNGIDIDENAYLSKFGDRAFSISAPRLWNALPQHLKDSTSCQAFKKCLKTHLFRLAH